MQVERERVRGRMHWREGRGRKDITWEGRQKAREHKELRKNTGKIYSMSSIHILHIKSSQKPHSGFKHTTHCSVSFVHISI